jgi:hypothetical protein
LDLIPLETAPKIEGDEMLDLLAIHGNGCVERFIRVLKENMLWQRRVDIVEGRRKALFACKNCHSQRLGSPAPRLPDARPGARRAEHRVDGRAAYNLKAAMVLVR